ncbi:NAD(P)/FAD-dependent oxidoreductase [Curtobacterium sp. PhB115]|uniref:NAD(P)/FAD-dependent oxidoreductase n=1 Tax=Curtobacterium sp. PhB115 TaxID=2485173 RepID=UPI000FB4FB8B|nr:NAD(P)/FAD-dependent oxidoreductase [Curtobacterium sp. PhB115]ROP65389.1 pyridine nucleotide-disulfide oxidoreductase [Curtobacterium sp. PhB115]
MHVVVVGASVAGLTVAEALRAEGHSGPVTLVGDEPHVPYGRPPLSKQVLTGTWDADRAALRTAAELDALDVTIRSGVRATGLEPSAHRLLTDAGPIAYDVLVVATGTTAVRPAVPGAERVHLLRTLDDAVRLRAAWASAERVVVIGSGVLASEIASAARGSERAVTMVGRRGGLSFGTVGLALSDRLTALHRAAGVTVEPSAGARAVEGTGTDDTGRGGTGRGGTGCGGTAVVLGDGRRVPADVVVAATGGRPNTAWLAGSGVVVDDGVCCDARGVAAPDVFAIGDVARWAAPGLVRAPAPTSSVSLPPRVEHQTNAIEQALSVAATITGRDDQTERVPFFWSEVHGVLVQAAGTFDPATPLEPWDDDPAVLVQHSDDRGSADDLGGAGDRGSTGDRGGTGDRAATGVVGWGAPRSFRRARRLLVAGIPTPTR